MAGTCNDCGASTWGRYRICPECRKERRKNYNNNMNHSKINSYGGYFFILTLFIIILGYFIYNYKIEGIFLFILGSVVIIVIAFYNYSDIIRSNKKKYICNNCNYYWKSQKTFGFPGRCPNCGNKNIISYLKTKNGKNHLKKAKIIFIIISIIFIFLIASINFL